MCAVLIAAVQASYNIHVGPTYTATVFYHRIRVNRRGNFRLQTVFRPARSTYLKILKTTSLMLLGVMNSPRLAVLENLNVWSKTEQYYSTA